jgi:hypothetical protein
MKPADKKSEVLVMKLATIAAIAAVSLTMPALAREPSLYQQILATPFLATVYATEPESIISEKCQMVIAQIGDHHRCRSLYLRCMQANGFHPMGER